MRRAFVIVAGLSLAVPAAVLALVVSTLFLLAQAGRLSVAGGLDLLAFLIAAPAPDALVRSAFRATAVICGLPVVATALIGEAAGLRSKLGYVVASVLLSFGFPIAVAREAGPNVIFAPDVAIVLLVTGVVAGTVYALAAAPRLHPLPRREPGAASAASGDA